MTVTTGRLELIPEQRGTLGFFEFSQLDFVPKRMFWLMDVPVGGLRGAHAHRLCRQFVVCLTGTVKASADGTDGSRFESIMTRGDFCNVPAMHWLDLSEFSTSAVVLVLASHEYVESDYIRLREEFDKLTR